MLCTINGLEVTLRFNYDPVGEYEIRLVAMGFLIVNKLGLVLPLEAPTG
jgi:hypothetical protein